MGSHTERFHAIVGVLPALAAFLLFLPTLRFGFLTWDDYALVVGNPLVTEHTFATLQQLFTTFDPQFYAPFTYLSFRIEHLLFGLNPMVFHATNVLLHAVNSVLVFLLLKRLLGSTEKGQDLSDPHATQKVLTLALIPALLFAVHPLNVETVAWISARKHLLVSFFMLLTILLYLDRKRPVLTFLLGLCAFLSSVSAVSLPVLLLLLDWFRRKGSGPFLPARPTRGPDPMPALQFLTPYVVLAAVFGIIGLFGVTHYAPSMPLSQFLVQSIESVLLTFRHVLLPLGLAPVYPPQDVSALTPPTLIPLLIVFFLLATGRMPVLRLCFGMTFALVAFAPSLFALSKASGMSLTQDRYAYLPLVGLLIILANVLEEVPRRFLTSLLLSVILVFGFMTLDRMHVWADDCAFYRSGVLRAPDHPRLQAGFLRAVEESPTGCT